ncbi:hypothetical protein NE237_015608 [Protea cynaroides]|uniref:Uncharacterized protein n=1 Tax=Protea cynaroides TaxID=273540 RepID=A0A9Q0QR71_9MAGN|nr:hypothetical protein NE237_015608 [Protea cynaroides]
MVFLVKLKLKKIMVWNNLIGQQKVAQLLKEFKNHWEVIMEMVAIEVESLSINSHPTSATMPRELLDAINEHESDDVMWVIEKTLTITDMKSQVRLKKFLTDTEKRQALYEDILVDVLLWRLIFKNANEQNRHLCINKKWAKLVVGNNLQMGDIV